MFLLAGLAEDLQGLTPLILGTLAFLALLAFRKPLAAVVYRLTGVKVQRGEWVAEAHIGDQDGSAEDVAPQDVEDAPDNDEDQREAPELLAASGTDQDAESVAAGEARNTVDDQTDADGLLRQMVAALFDKDEARARRVYERLQEITSDPVERKITKARWLALRNHVGLESEVLEKLTVLAEDDAAAPRVLYFKGVVLQHAGQPKQAAEAFHESSEREADAGLAARAAGEEAKNLQRAGEPHGAVETLQNLIRAETDEGAGSTLWSALADIYEAEQEHELRALALQQALAHEPSNPKMQFRIAYAYSETGADSFGPLVLHYYGRVLAFDPNDATAWNNAGVELQRLDLDIKGIYHYQQAVERDSTLASANLAYKLMQAGFADEAEEVLNAATKRPAPHENVASAVAALAGNRSSENERYAELARVGQHQAEFLSSFTQAGTFRGPDGFDGAWRFQSGHEVTLSLADDALSGEWEQRKVKHKLSATVTGASARGAFHEMGYWTYGGERKESGWERKDSVYLYLGDSGDAILVMRMKDKTAEFERMTRVV